MRAHTIIHLMTEGKQNDQPYRSRDLIIDTLLSLLIHFSLKQRRARRFHAPSLTLLPSSLTPERSHRAPFSRPSKVTAADSPLHHGAASVVDAAESPLAELYSEHTPWPLNRSTPAGAARQAHCRVGVRHGAMEQAEAAVLAADAGGGCLAGALSVCS